MHKVLGLIPSPAEENECYTKKGESIWKYEHLEISTLSSTTRGDVAF